MVREPREKSHPQCWELSPEQLRWTCDPSCLPFETTEQLPEQPASIIGQPRALESLELGLSMRAAGYNIFVAGEVGTGRSTAVRHQLETLARKGPPPPDLCFVYNFRDPDQPRLLSLPAGQGSALRRTMTKLVEDLGKSLAQLFDSDSYRARCSALLEAAKARHKDRIHASELQFEEEGFVLVQVEMGPHIQLEVRYLLEDKPVELDELEALVEQDRFPRDRFETISKRHAELQRVLESVTQELNRLERELRVSLFQLDRDLARPRIEEAIGELRKLFPNDKVAVYLDEVAADILDHLERFREPQILIASGAKREKAKARQRERMLPYAVNILVDHGQSDGPPILWETSPTFRNLFGTIDAAPVQSTGEVRTDHTKIKSGSLLCASGGILVLDAMDVLAERGVWTALKRTLRHRVLEIRSTEASNLLGVASLKPEVIPISVKVVLIGTHQIHATLLALDEDFQKVFKVKADFATDTVRSAEELLHYAGLARSLSKSESLLPLHRDAVAVVAEQGVRLAEHREKLTTRFHEIADLMREADHWARQQGQSLIRSDHIERAIERKRYRLDRIEEQIQGQILEGTLQIETDGEVVGQVNALTVLGSGNHIFSVPSRVTAVTAVGRNGIVNLERESRLSRSAHTKGLLILSGFLRSRFAQDWPLTLSASLCFEQSYGIVDGDSASAAELFALLSSLSNVPLLQSIAVTGSVDQKGHFQPVGAVNDKIEGFFDLCRRRGLDGRQGVLIPARNLAHLQLRREVVETVRQGLFHVYAASTVEQGIEILTGIEAGSRGLTGKYPAGSIFDLVENCLQDFALLSRKYGMADLKLEF